LWRQRIFLSWTGVGSILRNHSIHFRPSSIGENIPDLYKYRDHVNWSANLTSLSAYDSLLRTTFYIYLLIVVIYLFRYKDIFRFINKYSWLVYSGVTTLLKEYYPRLQTFHCMAHRLEIVEIRWAFSTFASLRAHLNDFPTLHAHLTPLGTNGTRSAKEARKCKGFLANKMSIVTSLYRSYAC